MHHVRRFLAYTAPLLLASGCVAGIDVGDDGPGGGSGASTSSGGGSSGTGGSTTPHKSACASPASLVCASSIPGGACGDGLPACDALPSGAGTVCVGGSTATPGTCANPSQSVQVSGGPCGGSLSVSTVCAWNEICQVPVSPGGFGTCVPRNCVLPSTSPAMPYKSAASLTVEGDGPTQDDGFACVGQLGGGQYTGEANAFFTPNGTSPNWLDIAGCGSPDGVGASMGFSVQLEGVGTVHMGQAGYVPPPSLGDMSGSYENMEGDPMTVTVTEMSDEAVSGSYDVVVRGSEDPTDVKHLTGTFDVCRLPFNSAFPPL